MDSVHHVENNDTASARLVADREAARLVELCADQIKAAVDEASREIAALSRSFLDTARYASALLGAVSDQNSDVGPTENLILADSRALQLAVQKASMRLQFADRLNQRLSNVRKNLVALAELMQSTDLPIVDSSWIGFLKQTRATFTMEQERQMFDAMFAASAAVDGADPATEASHGPTLFDGEFGNDG